MSDLSEQLFEMGSAVHLTTDRLLVFECDCCFDHLLFQKDGSFQLLSPCVENSSLCTGTYRIAGDTVLMRTDGRCFRRTYNWAHEEDSTLAEFTYDDTLLNASSWRFMAVRGNHGMELLRIGTDEIALPDPRATEVEGRVRTEIAELLKGGGH